MGASAGNGGDKPKPGSWYVVRPGDTLSRIAVQAYDGVNCWREILQSAGNKDRIKDAHRLYPGQDLWLPMEGEVAHQFMSSGAGAGPQNPGPGTHPAPSRGATRPPGPASGAAPPAADGETDEERSERLKDAWSRVVFGAYESYMKMSDGTWRLMRRDEPDANGVMTTVYKYKEPNILQWLFGCRRG